MLTSSIGTVGAGACCRRGGTCAWWYLMQRAHSKSLGSNRSLETFLQVFSLASMELLATPKIKKRSLTVNSWRLETGNRLETLNINALWPCFWYLLLALSTTEGSVSETDSFLFSRLPFSWSPSWGAELTLFMPSSPTLEPWIRSDWALLRPWRSRLSQRLWISKSEGRSMLVLHQTRDKTFRDPPTDKIWALPPGFPDACELRQRTLPAAVGQDRAHRPWTLSGAGEVTCCVPSPAGLPWLSLQLGKAGHTGSVEDSQWDRWGSSQGRRFAQKEKQLYLFILI